MDTPDNTVCIIGKRDGEVFLSKVLKLGVGTKLQEDSLLDKYFTELKDLI